MTFEFKLPDIGEGVHEGEIAKWHVKVGDTLTEDQPMMEVMTDKVTVEITAPLAGTVTDIKAKEGQVVKVGSVLITIEETGSSSGSAPAAKMVETPQSTAAHSNGGGRETVAHSSAPVAVMNKPSSGKVLASPATRKMARELNIDLSTVSGTGPGGRIRKSDLQSYSSSPQPVSAPKAAPAASKAPQAPTIAAGTKSVPYRGMRRKIGEHLVHSKHTAPHFTYVEEADMTRLVEMKAELEPIAANNNVKLSYLPFIMKAVIEGLKLFPKLNSTLDEENQEIILKYDYNIGVAVATGDGLIVPVVHQAQNKSIFQIAAEISSLADKARNNKLALNELQGGTFTLTSIGSIGGIFSAPIVNYPEVAIMGIQKIQKRPVVRNDEIVIREMTYLSISGDHRVVDGAEVALFMNTVVDHLEHPTRLLIQ